jgi:hypothetical protein
MISDFAAEIPAATSSVNLHVVRNKAIWAAVGIVQMRYVRN